MTTTCIGKRLLVLAGTFLVVASAHAQPWMQGREGERLKLQDIINSYQVSSPASSIEREKHTGKDGNRPAEASDYHYQRWLWYMQNHLDSEGYIVPQSKTLEEWLSNGALLRGTETASKTAGVRSSAWTFVGPSTTESGYGGIGRVQVITFHPTDSNTYWVGTAGGGAWKTTNDGVSWTCMTDMLPVLGVSDIVINPQNPKVIYLCTGDKDGNDNHSVGILKSTDGGVTWNTTGYTNTVQQSRFTNGLVMNPHDTSVLLVATSTGIYKSTDAGSSWNLRTAGDYKQIMYRPGDSNIVFAAGRPSSGGAWGIFRSVNGGNNWNVVYSHASSTRIAFAISATKPNTVKAVVANSSNGMEGVYNSVDTGKSFVRIFSGTPCNNNILSGSGTLNSGTCTGQAWYDLAIAISPLDSNRVLIGGVNTYQSLNGGTSWSLVAQWNGGLPGIKVVHADKHFLGYHPLRPAILFEGNDGGVYKTLNPASLIWSDLSNGLCVTQFYRNAVSNSASFVLGGSQDNGSKLIDFGGNSNDLTGGDGMQCAIDYSDPDIFYTAIQNGEIRRTMNGGTMFDDISNNIPGTPKGAWITPYVIDPLIPSTLYAGYKEVYRSDDRGDTWYSISPAFYNSINITHLTATRANAGTLYAIVNNQIRYTTNGGTVWNTLNLASSGTLSDIHVSPKNARNIWVTYSGYSGAKVYEYDTATGWKNRSAGLPNIPVNCITQDTSSGTIYIGTDAAVYYLDSGGSWQLYNNSLPAAEITDLSINYTTGVLWAATYGRGMWETPKRDFASSPSTSVTTTIEPVAAIHIAPNPVVDGFFTLSTDHSSLLGSLVSVTIADMSGKAVWSGKASFNNSGSIRIQAESLPRGHYSIQLRTEQGIAANSKLTVL